MGIKVELLIKNANYYSNDTFKKGNILVDKGRIVAIISNGYEIEAERVVDANSLHVIPGAIDSHVHFRDPGHTEREDFFTGSQAAAAGGITTVCEMPISNPPVYSKEVLDNRIRIGNEKSIVDFTLYGAAGYDNLNDIEELVENGVAAFKTFLQPAPKGREEEFKGLTVSDDGELYCLLKEAAKHNIRFFFHTENFQVIKNAEKMLKDEGVEDNSFHYRSRPKVAEIESVATLLNFAKKFGTKVGICHISAPEVLEMVKEARRNGVDVVAETCPHYLLFNHEHIDKYGAYAKCNPPLRSKEDMRKLWDYINDGTVDLIGSDHAPFLVEEKEKGVEDIKLAFAGMPGIEVFLPTMLDQVNKGSISLEKLVKLVSVNTAKIFGIYPQKGCIGVGSDADLTIIDMNKEFVIKRDKMYTKSKGTGLLFEDIQGQGLPVYTISRGNIVMEHGKVNKEFKGVGNNVRRGEICYL